MSVRVLIDTNSGEDALFQAVQGGGACDVSRQRLDVGDVLIRNESTGVAVCVERKTHADLCASIVDGRLAEQKSRMVEPTVRYVYAVEGSTVEPWDGFYRGSMRNRCIWGALVKLQLRDGFPVVHTRSPEDTAALVVYLAGQLRDDGLEPKARSNVVSGVQKRKRDNLSDPVAVLRGMLTVIPGMSVARADVVLRTFGTVVQLQQATASELATLLCGSRALGPKMAQAIKQVFFLPDPVHDSRA